MNRSRVYLPTDQFEPGMFPTILAIGDSWFWYPKDNVLEALARHSRLKDPYRFIQMLGYNGAKLDEYVFGRHAKLLHKHLSASFRSSYSAILISGAGNDAVDYQLALKPSCSGIGSAADCIDEQAMDAFIGGLSEAMGALLERISAAYAGAHRPDIFLHTYDYPVPDGRGFKLANLEITGPWLSTAMNKRAVGEAMSLRREICRILIDRVSRLYDALADDAERIYCIRSTNCLTSGDYKNDWHNELHPTRSGFAKIVDKRWIPELVKRGYAMQ